MDKRIYKNPATHFRELAKLEAEKHWFVGNYDARDQLMLQIAVDLYTCTEYTTFTEALEDASSMLTDFYNYRFNPKTRKSHNG